MNLIRHYLLNDYFKKFDRYFHVPRTWSHSCKAYYSWEDDHYCNFILLIVHALKLRYCDSSQLVISQENCVEEAIFVMKGKFQMVSSISSECLKERIIMNQNLHITSISYKRIRKHFTQGSML